VNKDDFYSWKHLPETQEAIEALNAEVEELKEWLASGATISGDSYAKTAIDTSLVVGRIRGLRSLLNMEHEDG